MELTPRRRHAISTILALALAIESVTAVAAAARVNGAVQDAPPVAAAPAVSPAAPLASVDWSPDALAAAHLEVPVPGPRAASAATAALVTTKPARPDAPPRPVRSGPVAASTAGTATIAYRGRNHVWIPALGISRSVNLFPCDRKRPPDNLVYRWGCAGTNNVYLLGHAYSVFKPLHDAYTGHRLKAGMKAYYADSNGKVHVYAVKWWKTTPPTTSASWAWAAQPAPSMTLQTCVGANSELRLMVRLVEVRS